MLAQDRTAEAAARAQREEAEERYKLLNGKLESVIETIAGGKPQTPFLRFGDRVRIEMLDALGGTIFGAIDQPVARYAPP